MAASRDLRSHVTEVVTCPICLELFNSPKSLPCLHTFCLKCIEAHCMHNQPGDEVACPVCRQKFGIPESGVKSLVSNFFIAGLVDARRTASDVAAQVHCEVCSPECDQNDSNAAVLSTMYCVDCNQKLCERCSLPHRRMKGGPHRVVSIGSEVETELIHAHGGKCDKHTDETVKLYCFDCKMNICYTCFAEEHQQHRCKNVNSVADECLKQIDTDIEAVNGRAKEARHEISSLAEEMSKFMSGVEDVKGSLLRTGETLKQLIDAQVNELMSELQSLKTETSKKIESLKDNVDMKLLTFETFDAYCSELRLIGKPCDITRAANDLHTRAIELLQNDATREQYSAPTINFVPLNIKEFIGAGQNFVGALTLDNTIKARVVHTLPEAEQVRGVTSLDDELYVLRDKEQEQVEVYNTTTTNYSLVRQLSVPGAGVEFSLSDMASCKQYRCLYIADWHNCCVHRVLLNGKATKWSVSNVPRSLSVTSQFTVLVTCYSDSKLLELTTEGKQLREINLQSDIVSPQHAIQLSNGQFVVSHGGCNNPVHRVCIVDTNGHVTQSYGGPRGSATVGQLNRPCHLAGDKDEFIFVADYNNSRVLLLSPTLSFVREIVSRDQLEGKPERLFLDVDRRRLYVADGAQVNVVQCNFLKRLT